MNTFNNKSETKTITSTSYKKRVTTTIKTKNSAITKDKNNQLQENLFMLRGITSRNARLRDSWSRDHQALQGLCDLT